MTHPNSISTMGTPLERAMLLTEQITDPETRAAMRELLNLMAALIVENRRMAERLTTHTSIATEATTPPSQRSEKNG